MRFKVPWTYRLADYIRTLPLPRASTMQWAQSLLNLTKQGFGEDELKAASWSLATIVEFSKYTTADDEPEALQRLLKGRVWTKDQMLRNAGYDTLAIEVCERVLLRLFT